MYNSRKRILFTALIVLSLVASGQEKIFEDGFENHDPVIFSTPVTEGEIGLLYSYDVDASDIDGDTLLYLLTSSPAGMLIDELTGEISWTPGQEGNFPVEIDVSDGQGGNAVQNWNIAVTDGPDTDEDGLSDNKEILFGTDPGNPDTDGDGLLDGDEVNSHASDPLAADTDSDGLSDGVEVNDEGTLPIEPDTDGDGFGDGTELNAGTNPLDPEDFPVGPPEPLALAPPVDPTVTTTLFNSVEFLYLGDPPIQTGVTEGAIDPVRVAVLRGKVMTREGAPLPGVVVTILRHPEFGQTISRVDGRYDMVVNGGGLLTIAYDSDGFLPGQRLVEVAWQDWVNAPDVALIPLDVQMTLVDLDAPGMKAAQGSLVTDGDGTRQATVLFPEGATATLVMPDGSSQPLGSLEVRATEYTVGATGAEAMPGDLPPSSAYTYAVELSVDEALTAGGQVEFSEPLPFYVENFLDFPVGATVPTGYYDREKSLWVPAPNGLVIEILAINGGIADIDSDGDSLADDPAMLAALGISDAERQALGAMYAAETSLWRVPIEHFTPWDMNWPYGPPDDAERPQPFVQSDGDYLDEGTCEVQQPDEVPGSLIQCRRQVLGESLPITGTPFTLNYRSNRVPGRTTRNSALIGVSGDSIPASLKRIDVDYSIGGQMHHEELSAVPGQSLTVEWKGGDTYGRTILGSAQLSGQVSFVYDAVYKEAQAEFSTSFAGFGDQEFSANKTRLEIGITSSIEATLGAWDSRAQGLGGWTLDVHHAYDVNGKILYLGNGEVRSTSAIGAVLKRVIGKDDNTEYESVGRAIHVGADNSVYFSTADGERIYRRNPDATIERVLGCNRFIHDPCDAFSDGMPATQVEFESDMRAVATGPDGSLYVAPACLIMRIDNGGIAWHFGGDVNNCNTESGNNGPVKDAGFRQILDMDVGPDGSIYLIHSSTVRRISPDGIITRFAGTGEYAYGGDGDLATRAKFRSLRGLSVGPDGTVYVADGRNFRIRAIGTDGIIWTVAGTGAEGFSGDGGPAREARIGDTRSLSAGPDGRLIFAETYRFSSSQQHSCRLRMVDVDGLMSTLIAKNGGCPQIDSWPIDAPSGNLAVNYELDDIVDAEFGPDGSVYLIWQPEVWKLTSPLPSFDFSTFSVASRNGSELFVFNAFGRHLQTVNTITGATLYEFEYDEDGLLSSVTDGDGKITNIEREANSEPIAIISPFGQRTSLSTSTQGFLSGISNPAGEQFSIVSTSKGLISRTRDSRGRISSYGYDESGRLISQADNAGYSQSLVRTKSEGAYDVVRTTGLSRSVTYGVEAPPGNVEDQIVTSPDGSQLAIHNDIGGGLMTSTQANGTSIGRQLNADPRFGMQAPISATQSLSLPGGLILEASSTREVSLDDNDDLLSLETMDQSFTINGKTTTSAYTASNRTQVSTSPEGRVTTMVYDDRGRVIGGQFGGLAPLAASYNGLGQIETITSGSGPDERVASFTYGADGFQNRMTDPLGRTVSFIRDSAGRVTTMTLPGNADVAIRYNTAGELIGLSPPGQPEHGFDYTLHGQPLSTIPPAIAGSGPTEYSWNDDRQLTAITRPGNEEISIGYDPEGRVDSLELSRNGISTATYSMSYLVANQLDSISGPDAQTVSYSYQGDLITAETWDGLVSGSVAWIYDDDLRLLSETINGGSPIDFTYDDDDLLTGSGDFSLIRNSANGLAESAALGVVNEAWTYNSFGEIMAYSASANAATVYEISFTRDQAGRITQKIETVGGITNIYDYEYSLRDELLEVRKNTVVVESYSYDENGNRTGATVNAVEIEAVYDDQDRLLSYGENSYSFTPSGRLATRTEPGDLVTQYDYDPVGNLQGVTLPDSSQISYAMDGPDRRIQRSVNGSVSQRYLYDGILPLAELDEFNNVISRFVYSDGFVPVYMIKEGVNYRLLTDQVGSVRLVINASTGVIAQRIDYDAFGNVLQDSNPGFQPFGFAGGFYDPMTGLLRFGSRDYDPGTGRWTAKDPIGFLGNESNLYRYAANNPVNYIDPTGTDFMDMAGGALNAWFDIGTSSLSDSLRILPGPGSVLALYDTLDAFFDFNEPHIGDVLPPPGNYDDFMAGYVGTHCVVAVASIAVGLGASAYGRNADKLAKAAEATGRRLAAKESMRRSGDQVISGRAKHARDLERIERTQKAKEAALQSKGKEALGNMNSSGWKTGSNGGGILNGYGGGS